MSFPLMESLICLSSRLRKTDKNIDSCGIISCAYKPIHLSKNNEKKHMTEKEIRDCIYPLYVENRTDILNRDFSFIKENCLVINSIDIGSLYLNTLTEGDDEKIKLVTSELLQLFYHVMDEKDQSTVKRLYKKKAKKHKPSNVNIAEGMEAIMEKHKHKLANAESNPDVTGEVLSSIFRDNGEDMAKMAQGVLGSLGLDPKKIAKQTAKKR